MRALIKVSIVIGFLVIGISSCKHSPEVLVTGTPTNNNGGGNGGGGGNTNQDPCDSNVVYFDKDILPILNSNCAMSGCHDAGTAEDGVRLYSYDMVLSTTKVVPNNPNKTEIYESLFSSKERMPPPPNAALSAEQKAMIAKWINQGAKNLTCNSGACDTTNVTYSGIVSKTINTYCFGCHNPANAGGGIDVSTYSGLASIAANGKLMGSINQLSPYSAMPKGGKLDDCKIKQIQKWVEKGYPNN